MSSFDCNRLQLVSTLAAVREVRATAESKRFETRHRRGAQLAAELRYLASYAGWSVAILFVSFIIVWIFIGMSWGPNLRTAKIVCFVLTIVLIFYGTFRYVWKREDAKRISATIGARRAEARYVPISIALCGTALAAFVVGSMFWETDTAVQVTTVHKLTWFGTLLYFATTALTEISKARTSR